MITYFRSNVIYMKMGIIKIMKIVIRLHVIIHNYLSLLDNKSFDDRKLSFLFLIFRIRNGIFKNWLKIALVYYILSIACYQASRTKRTAIQNTCR